MKIKLLLSLFVFISYFESQAEIVRFLQVSDKFFRGSQPKTEEDYKLLKENKVDTIINLRWDKSVAKSKAQAEALGFKFINVPLRADKRPADQDIETVLAQINNEANGRVYLHCAHGKDRTGLIGALYRVGEQNWSAEEAKKEWIKMGFAHKILHDLRKFFSDYTESLKRSEVGESFAPICSQVFK